MTTYDYRCETCNIEVEEVRSITDDTELICSGCGDPMKILITNCSFVLKGNWTGRDITEKKEREKRSEKLKEKTTEKAHYGEVGATQRV